MKKSQIAPDLAKENGYLKRTRDLMYHYVRLANRLNRMQHFALAAGVQANITNLANLHNQLREANGGQEVVLYDEEMGEVPDADVEDKIVNLTSIGKRGGN